MGAYPAQVGRVQGKGFRYQMAVDPAVVLEQTRKASWARKVSHPSADQMDSAPPAAPGAVPVVAMVASAIADRRMPGVADQRIAAVGPAAVARAAVVLVAEAVAFPAVALPAVALQAVALQAVVRKFAYYRIETGGSRSARTPLSR